MTDAHTPGPWETAATDDSLVVSGRVKIAATYEVDGDVWGAANARLIAAAPDLLEASRLALNALVIASRQLTEDHKMVLKGEGWAARDIASLRAAILKATSTEQGERG